MNYLQQIINMIDLDFKLLKDFSNISKFLNFSDFESRLENQKTSKFKKAIIPSNTKTAVATPKWSVLNKL